MAEQKAKLIILDRDGVINKDLFNYVLSADDFEFEDGSVEAIKRLKEMNYKIAVATNQACIGKGLLSARNLDSIHEKMQKILANENAFIDKIFYCPDPPWDITHRRKPGTGMLEEALEFFDANPSDTYMVGDKISDVEAASLSGCKPILVKTGYGSKTLKENTDKKIISNDMVFDNLLSFVKSLSNT